MHRRAFLAAASSLLAAAPARAQVRLNLPFGGKPKPKVDLAEIVRQTGAPALGGAVVTPTGTAFLGVAGVRRRGAAELVRDGDLWLLGSDTKPMTATLYARLVETGRAQWSARLPALFPDLKVDPAWADARIEDVLAHRAGITDVGVVDLDFLSQALADPRPPREQRTALVQAVLSKPPARIAGGFEYANLNSVIAGAALERIADRPFDTLMAAELFRPLGMAQAGFGAPQGSEPWGHQPGDDGRLRAIDPAAGAADLPALFAPASGVHASLADWARFARVFVADGAGYLKPETLGRLCRPWGGEDGEHGMAWQAFRERGWAQGPVLAQEGTNGLWHASAQIAPERKLAILTVANAESGGGVEACARAASALIAAYA